jgi:leucyl/phenylalanyl-tRNA--protein transferase
MILYPADFKKTKNLTRLRNKEKFKVRFDTDFSAVINYCRKVPRKEQDGTWITDEMIDAYTDLYHLGYCHSVETYQEDRLVGGLYGVSLGGVFFGESMFHLETDASKVALWYLVDQLEAWKFDFIDVQQETAHLKSLGAKPMDRRKFLNLLETSLQKRSKIGKWTNLT